jgi:hypothetical protein
MDEGIADANDTAPDESPILDALEQYAQFIDELYDVKQNRPKPIFFEDNFNRTAIRSVRRVLRDWDRAYNPNRPPSALIVRLSRKLPTVLSDIVGQPKRILQRRRAMEPIHRLKELDSTCVRWLTRQPGNTLAEKSGHRREVLAVQRYESVDTLENRVVRDLLQRCASLATSYLRQHGEKFPAHEWVRMTSDFLKLCRRLLALPHLQEVANLPSLPKPNYVLLHESRYKEVWRSYMEVIRQQRRRQQLWRWRHDVYAEMVTIAWMSSASRLMLDSTSRCAAHRYDLRVRETAQQGRFFDWASLPPIWKMNSESYFYVGTTDSIAILKPVFASSFDSAEGFSIARWNSGKAIPSRLRIKFQGEVSDTAHAASDQAILELDPAGASKTSIESRKEIVLPLRLIERPRILDEFIDEWCLP